MGDRDKLVDELAGDENNYMLVRPSSGLRSGYEAVNVWNGDIKRRSDDKEELVEWARKESGFGSHFDYVLEVHDTIEPTYDE